MKHEYKIKRYKKRLQMETFLLKDISKERGP